MAFIRAALPARNECVLVGIAEEESNPMKQEMLINVAQPEECRIAIVEDGVLEELYVERAGQDNYVGNIYKGVVVNLEPSIQAAFVDFGVGRNGFLHVSDIEPEYFRQGGYDPQKPLGSPEPRHVPQHTSDSAVGDEFDEGLEDATAQRPRNHRYGGRPRFKPQHSRTLSGVDAGVGANRRLAEDRGRADPPPIARHHARIEPAEGRWFYRPDRRQRPHQTRAVARHGLSAPPLEGDRPSHQKNAGPGGYL
jgi:Ribonuclease G/E